MTDTFDPRAAALNHAGRAETHLRIQGSPHQEKVAMDSAISEAVNAIVCGLVYVGDQIKRVADAASQRNP